MTRKFALIIGNTEYSDPGLMQLTAPGHDAQDFARVLQDQELCAFDEVHVLLNQPSSAATEAIDEFFDQKTSEDLLVLYFSGHGVRDEFGALYLAFKNTIRTRLRATAVKSEYIREAMDQSRSKRQVVVLDCCNSGAFPQGTKAAIGGPMGMASAFQGYGRFVLMASDATQFAWEGDKLIGEVRDSLFTHFLVKGLEGEADDDADGVITVDELYDYAFEQISRITTQQTPTKSVSRVEGDIILRRIKRLEDIKPVPLPSDLKDEAEDTRPYVREVAVRKLEKILQGKNLGMVRSALEALQAIASDENSTRRIALEATQVLETYRLTAQPTEQGPQVAAEPLLQAEPRPKAEAGPVIIEKPVDIEPAEIPWPADHKINYANESTPIADISRSSVEIPAVALPQSRKSKPWIWVGAVLGLLVVGGGAFGFFTGILSPLASAPLIIPALIHPSFTPTSVSIPSETAVPSTRTPFSTPSRIPTPTRTRIPTLTPRATATPVPDSATFNFNLDANCRAGPGTTYEEVAGFEQGQTAQIMALSEGPPRWWLVSIPGYPAWQCWVSDVTGTASGPLDNVPVTPAP